jgi:hypothetical protein
LQRNGYRRANRDGFRMVSGALEIQRDCAFVDPTLRLRARCRVVHSPTIHPAT